MMLFRKKTAAVSPPSKSPFNDASTLGSILLRMGKITREQLHRAVGVQARTDEFLLGALLIDQGAVSQGDVAKALEIQHKLRSGAGADAELSLLESALEEAAAASADLTAAIERRKQTRRDRGENTGLFLVPAARGMRTA